MALAPEREGRTVAADILNAHGAEFVGFYGRWAWQGLQPSSGRRPPTAAQKRTPTLGGRMTYCRDGLDSGRATDRPQI